MDPDTLRAAPNDVHVSSCARSGLAAIAPKRRTATHARRCIIAFREISCTFNMRPILAGLAEVGKREPLEPLVAQFGLKLRIEG